MKHKPKHKPKLQLTKDDYQLLINSGPFKDLIKNIQSYMVTTKDLYIQL